MPYPAYEGAQFYFSIPVGGPWRQEFLVIDRNAPGGVLTAPWTGWSATMDITDNAGVVVATLSSSGGGDGTISLGDVDLGLGAVVCALPSTFTAGMASTDNTAGQAVKAFVHAILRLTDPDHPSDPYPFAVGKGVVTRF